MLSPFETRVLKLAHLGIHSQWVIYNPKLNAALKRLIKSDLVYESPEDSGWYYQTQAGWEHMKNYGLDDEPLTRAERTNPGLGLSLEKVKAAK